MVYSKGPTPTIISSFEALTPLLKITRPYRGLFVGSLLCCIGFYLYHYASLLSQLVYVVCPQYVVVPITFFCCCPGLNNHYSFQCAHIFMLPLALHVFLLHLRYLSGLFSLHLKNIFCYFL